MGPGTLNVAQRLVTLAVRSRRSPLAPTNIGVAVRKVSVLACDGVLGRGLDQSVGSDDVALADHTIDVEALLGELPGNPVAKSMNASAFPSTKCWNFGAAVCLEQTRLADGGFRAPRHA